MDFKAIQIVSMTAASLISEIEWDKFGEDDLHTPVVQTKGDCHNLELLMEVMGTLSRMMDTRISYVTTEGKVIRERLDIILEISDRYRKELETLELLREKAGS